MRRYGGLLITGVALVAVFAIVGSCFFVDTGGETVIAHGLACPKEHMLECPNFWTIVRERVYGRALDEVGPSG